MTAAPVDALTLWYGDQAVAEVERIDGGLTGLRLRYREDWSTRPAAFAISVRFPLDRRVHEGQEIYFWLMNLLPEDDALRIVGHVLGVSDIDVLGLVGAMGGDLPGALVARPAGEPSTPGRRPRARAWTEAELARDIRRLPERPLLAGDEGVQMSLAGQQAKLPVVRLPDGRLALPLDGHPSTHILKPRSARMRGSVENEAYCMRLARRCGLDAAEVEVGRAGDADYLLVRRYDREAGGEGSKGGIARLHQEDLCQAGGFPPYRKYEWNARVRLPGPGAADLFRAASIGQRAALSRLRLLDAFVFNVLACNVDSHAKNYSLLHRGRAPELAPLYDVMCGEVYDGVTRNLPQKIAGKQRGDHVHGRHWARLAGELGLSPSATRRRVGALAARVLREARPLADSLRGELAEAPIVAEIADAVEARCRRVLANIRDDGAAVADDGVAG